VENLSEAIAAYKEKKAAKKLEKKPAPQPHTLQQQPNANARTKKSGQSNVKKEQPSVGKEGGDDRDDENEIDGHEATTAASSTASNHEAHSAPTTASSSTTTTNGSSHTSGGVIHLFNSSNTIASSLLRPWTMTHLKALPKIPKKYILRLVHMCSREFLARMRLSTRTLRMEVMEFLAVYRKWCDLLSSQPQTRAIQPQYFTPVDATVHIMSLPHDALFTAFIQLDDLRDIIACAGTCVSWHAIACSGRFWRPMYLACASIPSQSMIARYHGDYRELFFQLLESWGRPQQSRGQANALCLLCQEFAGLKPVGTNYSAVRNREKLIKLLEKGYDPNFPGKHEFPMRLALTSGSLELIQLLMLYGGNPTPFMQPTGKNAHVPFFTDDVWQLVRSYQDLHEGGSDGGANESRRYLRRRGWKHRFANNGDSWLKNLDFKSA
jgi:hypothetical protein